MSLSFSVGVSLTAIAAAAGAGGVADRWYFATPGECIWGGTQAISGSRTLIRGRVRLDIASFDRKDLKFSFGNANNATAYDVIDAAIEAPNGSTFPVRRGAADSFTVAGSSRKTWTDVVTAAECGYTKFTVGETWWLNYIVTAPASTSNGYGNVAFIYNPGNTTPKPVDTSGSISFTGSDFGSATGVNIITVGRAHGAISRPVWFVVGDSIGLYFNDTGDGTLRRKGYTQRGAYDSDVAGATCDAVFNSSVSGQTTAGYLLDPHSAHMRDFAQYATHVFDEIGINDLGVTGEVTSLATMYANIQSIYAGLAAAAAAPTDNTTPGSLLFYRDRLLTYATGTFPAGTGQAVRGVGFAPGGRLDQFNAGLASQPGVVAVMGGRDLLVDEATNLWLANMSADGLHPTATGHITKAGTWRTFRQAVTV